VSRYQFIWRIRAATPHIPARVQIVTLDGKMTQVIANIREEDLIIVTGPFGTDLCVVGGWAEIEHVTNKIPDNPSPCDTPVYFATEDCYGNEIDYGDELR
jgi:hypothetical protein